MDMRKIETKEDINKKKQRNQIIIGLFIILLMIISTIGYSFLQNEEGDKVQKVRYGNYDFIRSSNFWSTQVSGQNFYFENLPEDVKNVSIIGSVPQISSYLDKPLYFVNYNSAAQEIIQNFQWYISRYQEVCLNTTVSENCLELPIKDCTSNIIIFDLNQTETRVIVDNNCVYISGDFIKASDVFTYKTLNIL